MFVLASQAQYKHAVRDLLLGDIPETDVRLPGKLVRAGGRSTNDLWFAIANQLGHPMTCSGDRERCDGPRETRWSRRPGNASR